MTYYFRNKSSIIDIRLGYIWASENIEIFKVKLRWSKSSQLLKCIAFLVALSNKKQSKIGIDLSNKTHNRTPSAINLLFYLF